MQHASLRRAVEAAGGAKQHVHGTHRVVHPETTLALLAAKLRQLGITRVANVTGLDYLGIPVVVSVRPTAKGLSVQQGKGLTLAAAKVSAIMELVESFCAQAPLSNRMASLRDLDGAPHVYPENAIRTTLPPDEAIPWIAGRDLIGETEILVPEELVKTDFSWPPPRGHGFFLASSTGLAAGNTLSEACLHGLCEVIERDAFALWQLGSAADRARRAFDPRQSPDGAVGELLAAFEAARLDVSFWDMTSDLRVPAFYCEIDDRRGRPPFLGFGGLGCHPCVSIALTRALTEAAQSRLTFIVGSPRTSCRSATKRSAGAPIFRASSRPTGPRLTSLHDMPRLRSRSTATPSTTTSARSFGV